MINQDKENKKVNDQENLFLIKDKKRLNTPFILFMIINLFLFVNLILLSLIAFTADNGLSIYGVARIKGIPYDQEIINDNQLRVGILRTKKLDINNLKTGDFVVAPNKKNSNYLWGAKVVSIDFENEKVVAAVNEYYVGEEEIISFKDIKGSYDGQCTFFGKSIYLFSEIEGFFFIVLISLAISLGIYFAFIYKKPKEKEISGIEDEKN